MRTITKQLTLYWFSTFVETICVIVLQYCSRQLSKKSFSLRVNRTFVICTYVTLLRQDILTSFII
mgnify:CR=1 FL=1